MPEVPFDRVANGPPNLRPESGEFLATRSRCDERDVHEAGASLAMLQPIRHDTEGERLHQGASLHLARPVRHDARQIRNVGDPATILFLLEYHLQAHRDSPLCLLADAAAGLTAFNACGPLADLALCVGSSVRDPQEALMEERTGHLARAHPPARSGHLLRDDLQRGPVFWGQRDLRASLSPLESGPAPTRSETIRKLAGQVLEVVGRRERTGVLHGRAQSRSHQRRIDLGLCLPDVTHSGEALARHFDCHRPNQSTALEHGLQSNLAILRTAIGPRPPG